MKSSHCNQLLVTALLSMGGVWAVLAQDTPTAAQKGQAFTESEARGALADFARKSKGEDWISVSLRGLEKEEWKKHTRSPKVSLGAWQIDPRNGEVLLVHPAATFRGKLVRDSGKVKLTNTFIAWHVER